VPGRDLHQLPGTILKTLKWSALGAALREIGYAGSFNMEIAPYEMTEKAERAYYALAYAIAEGLLSK
jgi:sugar phosphate isomerase/epimerase